ncbi:MAG TPA: GNAT family N-acetyltransferase [Candidatus Acidoferrales bacterium]|jgi:ribosomal-protein-alanine N-acetyltransferase|nr:GNAT family N-acetyltransferase [Candidatus Acidoferrales bacterium]
MDELPVIETARLSLFIPGPNDAARCVRFNRDNEAFLKPWEPPMNARSFEPIAIADWRSRAVTEAKAGTGFSFALVARGVGSDSPILGWCNFTNVIRGIFQACFLGYKLDERSQGQGYMTEALGAAIDYLFSEQRLHRIQANYMPHNQKSAAVLRRLGFTVEGTARNYLFIGGQWRDHVLTSLVNPDPLVAPKS